MYEKKMIRTKELGKNTLIITIGRISTQFITFLLLPLYTAVLSTEEYGSVDLVTTIVQLLVPIVSIMIDQGVFRYLLTCQKESQKKSIISNAFFILFFLNLCFLLLYIFLIPVNKLQYKVWILLILTITTFSNLFLQISRGLKKTIEYTVGSFICSFITIILNVLCIAFIKMGAVGMLISTFIGNLFCCLFIFVKLRIYRYISIFSISKIVIIEEIKYSMPLVPNQLSIWVMNSSDRLVVAYYVGAAANGVLAVSHKFPTVFMTLFNIFLLAWHETGAVHYFDEDRDSFFTKTIEQIITIFSTICVGMIVVLPIIFDWFINKSFSEAYYNIPIYLIASLFNVIVGLLGVVYVATKKTFEIAKTTMISAAINIIVNIVLIPYIGLYAASLSTFVGYLVAMIYRIIDTRKYLCIKYNIKKYLILLLGIIMSTIIYYINKKIITILFIPFYAIYAIWLNRDFICLIKNCLIKRKEKYE